MNRLWANVSHDYTKDSDLSSVNPACFLAVEPVGAFDGFESTDPVGAFVDFEPKRCGNSKYDGTVAW